MIKDFLVSFKDNFNEKSRNPFLGTYLLVWLIRNWELVYTLFNFDPDKNLAFKKQFIKNYYSNNEFIENLFVNVLWAFALLTITYIVLNISRFIVNLSEKQVTPWVFKITDSKSIVLKSQYDEIRNQLDILQIKLDKERDAKSKMENRIEKLNAEIQELRMPGYSTNKDLKNENDSTSILLDKLEEKDLIEEFKKFSIAISQEEYVSNDYENRDLFIELGLIKFEKKSYNDTSRLYSLTEDALKVLRKLRLQ
ncbi:hypothetical protein JCM19297_921 [Nonlabens ulvanivorans]|nr:hypothetical protein [Nonlabens ulvanivorans]GAK91422.1 hypothetical protein JCM19297_921 [Nonlabens ulvanivorans]